MHLIPANDFETVKAGYRDVTENTPHMRQLRDDSRRRRAFDAPAERIHEKPVEADVQHSSNDVEKH